MRTPFDCCSELFRWLENRDRPLRYPDYITRLRVPPRSACPCHDFKRTKTANLDMVALFESVNDRGQKSFQDCRCISLRQPCCVGNLIDDVGLGHYTSLYPTFETSGPS